MRVFVLLVLLLAACAPRPCAAAPEPRAGARGAALLVANSAYVGGRLGEAPLAGARALERELTRLGFEATLAVDLDRAGMRRALDAFAAAIRPGAPALFFFSGYGVEAKGEACLIPLGADVWTEADARAQGIALASVFAAMDKAGAVPKVVILDASRRNPFERRFRGFSAGLGALEPPPQSLLLSAAQEGQVVEGAPGTGPAAGVFVSELIKEMRAPDASADDVFNRTRLGVSRASGGRQTPLVRSTLTAPFFLAPQSLAPPPGLNEDGPADAQAGFGPPRPLRPRAVFRDCAACPSLVVAPAGEFQMGSEAFPAERPVHAVKIARPFAIGRFEVTRAQWDACVAAGGCEGPRLESEGEPDAPAGGVSFEDARAYVAWLARTTGAPYRLPSEAEWEFSARGGTTDAFWWGEEAGSDHANCRGCGGPGRPTVAGAYPANPFGLYDTSGNIAEWVADCWRDSYADAPRDGGAFDAPDCRIRVARGGSYDSAARFARSAARFPTQAELRYHANGLRVARDLP